MAETFVMRATSLAGSALVLALVAVAALSLRFPAPQNDLTEGFAFPAFKLEQPQPPPIVRDRPPQRPIEPADFTADLLAPPTLAEAPPQSADIGLPAFETGPALIADAHWTARPRDLARYYPRRALLRGIQGEALLDCRVSVAGLLDCSVLSETPAGWEFGLAAQRIARDHRMVPAMRDGVPVEGRYRMRVPFTLD